MPASPTLAAVPAAAPESEPANAGAIAADNTQPPAVRVRAPRSGPREVDLRVHWEDEIDASAAPPSHASNPPPTVPAAVVATAGTEETDRHALPELHHLQTPLLSAPTMYTNSPANPAARPPNPGMYSVPSPIHVSVATPTSVFIQ